MDLVAKPVDPVLAHAESGDVDALRQELEAAETAGELPKKLRLRDQDRRTALHRACSGGHREAAALLIAKGAKVDVEDEEEWTPLHSSASRGDAGLVDALLNAKADANGTTSAGATALHFCASKGHTDVIDLLLGSGADKNARDKRGGTPFLRAAGAGRTKVMQQLLSAKADPSVKDKGGENCMHVAINGQHVEACSILFELDSAKALMSVENQDGKTAAQLLLEMLPLEVRDTLKSVWRDKQAQEEE
eukprot:TRINITY_DN26475_c0_g1_i1.p1 TRINITY_DN26475_c0_g1~~TRINITY_DN26475_c0_g1_i1.p1  ORF type:complete len:248 (-),score=86.46 TRINITY_DN26475_c0_g1_i1:131-874(-)